jgi:hypothetical protein
MGFYFAAAKADVPQCMVVELLKLPNRLPDLRLLMQALDCRREQTLSFGKETGAINRWFRKHQMAGRLSVFECHGTSPDLAVVCNRLGMLIWTHFTYKQNRLLLE